MFRLFSVFALFFSALTVNSTPTFAQSCSLADVNTVNTNLAAPLAGGSDVIEIDLDVGGTITCSTATGSANTAFNDRAEISHQLTAVPTDLHFVVDRDTAITAVNISGPGLAAGGVSPGDDDPVDLSAGTYFVTMTVNGMPVSFNFTIVELAPDDQRLAAQPLQLLWAHHQQSQSQTQQIAQNLQPMASLQSHNQQQLLPIGRIIFNCRHGHGRNGLHCPVRNRHDSSRRHNSNHTRTSA